MARPAELLSVEEGQGRILAGFSVLPPEHVELERAMGRVLAMDIRAPRSLPPFANSSMDGFALHSASTAWASQHEPATLRVVQHVAAGDWSDRVLATDESARIMTGAPLPPGADAVIPFEEVEDRGDAIVVHHPVGASACVRPAGQDVHEGDLLLPAGVELRAPQIGLLAANGMASTAVRRRPSVAILSTGNELVQPGEPLRPGRIYNSNSPMLAAAVAEAGGETRTLPATGDDPEAIAAQIQSAHGADLLLTSGGASVGDYDHVKDVIGSAGSINFWRVRVRPGKPLIFGTYRGTPVIGLPGNPTSAMVTFEIFVRPAIRTMLGAPAFRPQIEAVIDEPIDNRGGRRTFARVTLRRDGETWHARLAGGQDSAMLLPLARADGLMAVPEWCEKLAPGERGIVQVWRLPPD